MTIDTIHEARLGEIRDADIVIFRENIKEFTVGITEGKRNEKKKSLQSKFFNTLLHEMLHSLGLDHNFALGTIMDYHAQEISGQRNIDLHYEMETLSFLYKNDYKKKKNWPLIRTEDVESAYVPGERYAWDDGLYTAKINSKSLICERLPPDEVPTMLDYTEKLPDNFQLRIEFEECSPSFLECGSSKVYFDNLIDARVFPFIKSHTIYSEDYARMTPVIHLDYVFNDEFVKEIDQNIPTFYIESAAGYLVYPTLFSEHFWKASDIKSNTLNWKLKIYDPASIEDDNSEGPLSCELRVDFDVVLLK